jgi:hypothetical protein
MIFGAIPTKGRPPQLANSRNLNLKKYRIMKNYFIECEHNIYVDNYEQGEEENINNFDTKGMYKAENSTDAIEQHLKSLGYNFDKDYMQIDEEDKKQNSN